MAKYNAVNGVYRKVAKKYDPVDGVHRKVTKAFEPVGGVYRQYFSGDLPVETLAVGDSVWLNVNGSLTEFLVVHQGNPDTAMYDASCDGTWLLMKDIYVNMPYPSRNYKDDMHTYLNETFYGLLDGKAQSAIKQVKIPNRINTEVVSGSSGLSAKIFLLAGYEAGFTTSDDGSLRQDGACLDYFSGATNNNRISLYKGTASPWWTRTNPTSNTSWFFYITSSGSIDMMGYGYDNGIRPAFILDSSTPITQSGDINIIA